MEKSIHHPDNMNWDALYEIALKVKAENEIWGLPFDSSPELEEYIKKKEALTVSK